MMRSLVHLLCAGLLFGCTHPIATIPTLIGLQGGNPNLILFTIPTGTASATAIGSQFNSDTVVYWKGKPLATTYLTAKTVTIAFQHGETDLAGQAQVYATDGGIASQIITITIADAPLSLNSLAPTQVPTGAQDTTLTLTGTGFRPTSQVLLDGAALATSFVSSTSLTAVIPASMLAVAADLTVDVQEPACDQQSSCFPNSAALVFSVGPSTWKVVDGDAEDVIWDPVHSLLLVSFSQDGRFSMISAVEPVSAQVQVTMFNAFRCALSLSSDDQLLYALSLNSALFLYDLPGLTGEDQVTAYSLVAQVAPAPDQPATFAFLDSAGIGIVDGTTLRPSRVGPFHTDHPINVSSILWGNDGATLYGIGSELQILTVGQDGVHPGSTSPAALTGTVLFDRATQRLYSSNGQTFDARGGDPQAFSAVAALANSFDGCLTAAVDGALGKAFFVCAGSTLGLGYTVRSFDLRTLQPISQIIVPADDSAFRPRIVRWGTDGLAIATAAGLYLYNGTFVR
jgi:hypothetical protein